MRSNPSFCRGELPVVEPLGRLRSGSNRPGVANQKESAVAEAAGE
jgi:hypothetical protein